MSKYFPRQVLDVSAERVQGAVLALPDRADQQGPHPHRFQALQPAQESLQDGVPVLQGVHRAQGAGPGGCNFKS